MGREIKRVPLDFNWPPREIWEGYINPHYRPCPKAESGACQAGQTLAGAWLDALCRFIALVGEQALGRQTGIYPHPYLQRFDGAPSTRGEYDMSSNDVRDYRVIKAPVVLPPSREMYDLVAKLCEQGDKLPGLSGMRSYKLREKLLALGEVGDTWGICPVCKGEGIDPEAKEAYEAWESYEPPTGKGWQVWETVSEGSPVSPVLPTAEALVDWLCEPKGSDERWTKRGFYGDGSPSCYSEQGQSREAAECFVRSGWVPSGASGDDGVLLSGIAASVLMGDGEA